MATQEVTGVQLQMAAAAGVKLLQIEDLPVPMSIAKSGALSVLDGMLQAIARGELVVVPNPELQEDAVPVPPTPPDGNDSGKSGELSPPGLGRIDGGKAS